VVPKGFEQQAARRLRAAADRGRWTDFQEGNDMKIAALFALAALSLVARSAAVAGQQPGADKQQVIMAAVAAVMDQYNTWFAAGRADLIAERTYLTPSVRMDETGLTVFSSRDEIERFFEASLQTLGADGYAKSEWPVRNVCVLNEAAAVVSGRYIRYRKDGSVIGQYGGTYTLAKTADGWRIASFARHDPSKVVRCAS
jgi:hypothetical protein